MRTNFIGLIFLILINWINCKPKVKPADKTLSSNKEGTKNEKVVDTTQKLSIKRIKLANELSINIDEEEDFDGFKTYAFIEVVHHNKIIYTDSTEEYEFGDKLYPIVNELDNDGYEVLLEINDRPNRNKLKYLKIQGGKIIADKELPTFIAKASNLDRDSLLESAGYWDYAPATESQNNISKTTYNPIIYYEWTNDGLRLDSTLTIQKNTEIYDTFKGFDFIDDTISSTKQIKKFIEEVKAIELK